MMVVDASALIDKLTFSERGDEIERLLRDADALASPELVYTEVASALWRQVRADVVSPDEANQAIDDLLDLPLIAVPLRGLLSRAWEYRQHTRISDSFYLASAYQLGATLLTTDARLARGHHGISVTLVS